MTRADELVTALFNAVRTPAVTAKPQTMNAQELELLHCSCSIAVYALDLLDSIAHSLERIAAGAPKPPTEDHMAGMPSE